MSGDRSRAGQTARNVVGAPTPSKRGRDETVKAGEDKGNERTKKIKPRRRSWFEDPQDCTGKCQD